MTPRSDILFRRVGTVTLTRTDGSQAQGFGMVIPWGAVSYTHLTLPTT